MDEKTKRALIAFQKSEITEHIVYGKLARSVKGANATALKRISEDELKHYNLWKRYTNTDVRPDSLKILKYSLAAKIAGITFAIKSMESGENKAQAAYKTLLKKVPDAKSVIADEAKHEKALIKLIDEEKLQYIGSMVLGLNDALVELTGTIAGLTLALQNTRLVGTAGLITGIAASLSMMSSEYLSKRSDAGGKSPLKAAAYTGIAYILAVLAVVFPFFVFENAFIALAETVLNVIIIIFIFTYFISVTKEQPFRHRFLEMVGISLGVAVISFCIGFLVNKFLHVAV
jgi:VIT1/CCC1 family predicted Fe2+/Mn2+ transporter